MFRFFRSASGFTLMELIVVMAVVAILVTLAVPRFVDYVDHSRLTRLAHDARLAEDACARYHQDHGEWPRCGIPLDRSFLRGENGDVNWYTSRLINVEEDTDPANENFWDRVYDSVENPDGDIKLYRLDADALKDYVKLKISLDNFVLRNPAGRIYIGDVKSNPLLEDKSSPGLRAPKPGEFEVWTAEDLAKVGTGIDGWDLDCSYIQMADIDLSAYSDGEGWVPRGASIETCPDCDGSGKIGIGQLFCRQCNGKGEACIPIPFTGTYDGNGFVISNLTINRPDICYQGLFSYVEDANLVNIRLEAVNVEGYQIVGGLVGKAYGGSIENCCAAGSVMGCREVGGLVGNSYYTSVTNGRSACNVVAKSEGYAGGLVGIKLSGFIENCYSTGSVGSSTQTDRQVGCIGGLVGENAGSIKNCCSTSSVKGYVYVGGLVGNNDSGSIENCYSTGSVEGNLHVGGLVGQHVDLDWEHDPVVGFVKNCYSVSPVRGNVVIGGLAGSCNGYIENSYSAGLVEGNSRVGGLVGVARGPNFIASSFWDIQTSGQLSSDGGEPKTTAELKQRSTFENADWDFERVWAIDEGTSYPYLRPNEQVPHPGLS